MKENIERFGGDPSCVTIFGQSAGGTLVSMLAASPAAKDLFHRVISEVALPSLRLVSEENQA